MDFSTKPEWWMTDQYVIDDATLPRVGAMVPATVKVNSNGSTQEGWGELGKKQEDGTRAPGFMPRYLRNEFNPRLTEYRYRHRELPFAHVMRAVPMICVDIDGKNGGFSSTAQLGLLPPTLAETSKSGNGYHLFYETDEDWDQDLGYAAYDDHIGIAQGIDIRATGCVYHYATQRWNQRPLAPLPNYLASLLREKKERRIATRATIVDMKEMDMDDLLVAQHTLLTELAKPVAAGKRNNTLFAIGSKLMEAGIPDWETAVHDRALQLGLDVDEAEKLVSNITAYGV